MTYRIVVPVVVMFITDVGLFLLPVSELLVSSPVPVRGPLLTPASEGHKL